MRSTFELRIEKNSSMSEIKVSSGIELTFLRMRCKEKSPPGHPSPIAKNLSKLEGDQVGHIVILSLIRAVLCSAALRVRMIAGHRVPRGRKSRKRKKPTQVPPPLEGAACMGLWNISINLGRVCFTHPYYNKVGTRMIQGKKKARQPCRMYTVGGPQSVLSN